MQARDALQPDDEIGQEEDDSSAEDPASACFSNDSFPPEVTGIKVSVSAKDMETVSKVFDVQTKSGEINNIPAGEGRTVWVQGIDRTSMDLSRFTSGKGFRSSGYQKDGQF